ncbi:hypothetical protein E2C01_077312 [Portunus trituberculatus]|uniref:Uncharacterized protein n=1 Tax=Portunus trituberculatus TaxID=210409 RepID=A0A5B7ILU2_PORTR|nr:hypothetical protein [Portunus trituberculatus]
MHKGKKYRSPFQKYSHGSDRPGDDLVTLHTHERREEEAAGKERGNGGQVMGRGMGEAEGAQRG